MQMQKFLFEKKIYEEGNFGFSVPDTFYRLIRAGDFH
jgi:hypothetical protein